MRLDRLNRMEEYILEQGTCSLEELAGHFDVSINTVRRDVKELTERGRISKIYGGVSSNTQEAVLPMAVRSAKNTGEKRKIGRLAADLVHDGDTIFLDSGSTVCCMIPYLNHKNNVTLVTHSLNVLVEASKYPSLQVIALGGLYSQPTSSYVGNSTLEGLSRLSFHEVFIAATGVSLSRGLTNTTYFEAEIKQKVVCGSDTVILLADHTKFGTSSSITFFDFDKLHSVVTDKKPPKEFLAAMKESHIQLIC